MKKQLTLPIVLILAAPFLYILSRYNYAMFHLTMGFFSVTIGIMIFTIALISQKFAANTLMERFGYGLLASSILVLFHVLTFKGLNIVVAFDENISTQFWVALNIIQALSLLIAILSLHKKMNKWIFITFYLSLAFIVIYLCFEGLFPVCFIEGSGVTPFKTISEYIVIVIYVICLILLYFKRDIKELKVYTTSIIMFLIAGLVFTLPCDGYGIQEFSAPYFRMCGLITLFFSIVVTNIQKPYDVVFKDLKNLSEKDGLTKLYNRNYLNQFLTTVEQKGHNHIFMVLFDVDSFKNINDTYGHDIGDDVLKEVSEIMQRNIRINDMAIRFGGDEFLIIFTRTTAEDAKKSWERVNAEINKNTFTSKKISLTVSAGFGFYNGDFEKTFKEIDSLVLDQKKNGKNKTRYSI